MALAPVGAAQAQAPDPAAASAEFAPGEVIVRYRPGVDAADRSQVRDTLDAGLEHRLALPRAELLELEHGSSPAAAAERLERLDDVLYAEPNFTRRAAGMPNDARFSSLYGLNNTGQSVLGVPGTVDADIDAVEAWDLTTGSSAQTVAVVDSGMAYDHPDLAPNLYRNPGESGDGRETNRRDDDGNGFVDDYRGWDWIDGDSDPRDLNGHGTHVAGTVGARGGDGYGVAGVSWSTRLMPLRVLDAGGFGNTDDVIAAYTYAARQGVEVVNASLGGAGFSRAERDAIAAAPKTLFVVAAGNGGEDGVGDDVDATPGYPCAYDVPNIVCVAATDNNDALAPFSNYGATSVDLAAPGRSTLSTQPAYETVFSEDFETGMPRWSTGGTGQPWGLTTHAAAGGTTSLADSPSGDYANGTDSFTSSAVPIPLLARSGCVLEYRLRLAVQPGDKLRVEASTNNATWSPLSVIDEPTGDRFLRYTNDISSLDGQASVYLRFRLTSDGAGTADGAYLDDLKIRCLSSTYTGSEFAYYSGTSMATPHVAGAAALVFAKRPTASPLDVREALLTSADRKPALAGKSATGGRLNALVALGGSESTPVAPAPAAEPAPAPQPTAPPAASDLRAPGLTLSITRGQRLAAVLRGGLRVSIRCTEDCYAASELVVGRTAARRLRIAGSGATVRVGRGASRLAASRAATVRLRLTANARRRLARSRSVELWVRTRATDASGNGRSVARRVLIRR